MKKFILFISLITFMFSAKAQSGAFCEGATQFPNSNSCFNNQSLITDDIQWYSFVAGETNEIIELKNLDSLPGHIHRMEFYSGTCAGNNLILTDSVDVTPSNDTLLTLYETGLTIGNTYYIKLFRGVDGCGKCTLSGANYNLCLLETPELDFIPDNDTIFAGNTITFSNISTNFASSQVFIWNFGDVCIDTAFTGLISGISCTDSTIGQSTGISHFYSYPPSFIVTLSASDMTGSYNVSKTIYVLPPPVTDDCGAINCEMVCNGQLETFNWCPATGNLTSGLVQCWANTFNSSGGFSATSDYWLNNSCSPFNDKVPNNFLGCQTDQNTGNAYIGVYTYTSMSPANYREYATSRLCIPMIAGQQYNVSYWVSLGDVCKFATQAPRAYFSNIAPIQPSTATTIVASGTNLTSTVPFGIITNDTSWTHITAVYTANGGEQQITLGNFSDDAFTPTSPVISNNCGPYSGINPLNKNGAYYYIDSISVTPVANPLTLAATDTVICAGTVDTLYASGGSGGFIWLADNDTIVGAANDTLYIAPDSTIIYTVVSFNSAIGCLQSQTVTIFVDQLPVITVNSDTICYGQSAILTASGGTSYIWSNGAVTNPIIVSPTVTTTYIASSSFAGCTGSGVGIVVVNNPTLSSIQPSYAICVGTNIPATSFTSSPVGGTFSWTNSNPAIGLAASGSGNVPAFTTTNTTFANITATISVITTDSLGCSGSPVTYTITVYPIPNVFVPSNFSICNGDITSAITFTSSVLATTYTWTNSNPAIGLGASGIGNIPSFTGTNGTASPINGTVTVTPTANGCVGTTSVFVITVNPTPVISVSPSAPTIASGTSAILTASGGTTYLWSTGSSLNPITVSPSVTTTYTVTGTNTFTGCTSTTTVTVTVVPPACLIPLNYDVPAGSNVTSAFPGFPTGLSGKTIRIDGVFTIDVPNFAFSACNVIMMPNASIVVPSNTVLQLTNKTHMFSCDSMWDGIFVLAGGNLLVNSNSMIEDGKKAINIASGGFASVIESIFNRNYTSIEITSNTGATSPLNINNCVFTSRNIPTAANPTANPVTATVKSNVFSLTPTWVSITMKPPFSSFKSINGINSTDVSTLNIGSAISIYNGFENIGCGIRLSNGTLSTASIAIISGNRFQNMVNGSGCFLCPSLLGTGISASGTATGDNRILVGGNLTSEANQFRNTFTAVEVNNYKQARVLNNSIVNNTTMPLLSLFGFGRIGILIRPSLNNTLRVANNSVTNCINGIWINRSLNGINTTSILVEDNSVNANSSGYCSNGIAVSDVINTGSTTAIDKIKIRNNNVSQAFNCVSITNVKNGLIVYQNPNLIVRNDGINLGNGIRLQNCKSVRVHNNPNITVTPLSTPATSTNINYKGIQVITSPESWVSCNKIFSMGESMTYVGNCSNSSIFDNQMTSGNRGFVLRNNGEVGQQLTSTIPCANAWSISSTFSFQTYTDNTTTANSLSKFYVNSVGIPVGHTGTPTSNFGSGVPTTFYSTSLGGINVISNAFLPIPCSSVAIFLAPAPGGNPSLAQLQSLATDNNSYPVYENSNRFHRKKYAFEILDADSGASADTSVVLQDFYDSTQVASLGILNFADKAIVQNDYLLAEINNLGVYSNNIMEENQKQFNSLYLLLLNNDLYEYTIAEKADLYSIASQCHLEGGNAVWQARVLVWTIEKDIIEFPDNCNAEPRTMDIINNEISDYSANFNVYPNPSMGAMELSYSLNVNETGIFEVYDISGKQIMNYLLDKNSNKLKIENKELSAGVYYYSIRLNEKIVKTEKLVIVK